MHVIHWVGVFCSGFFLASKTGLDWTSIAKLQDIFILLFTLHSFFFSGEDIPRRLSSSYSSDIFLQDFLRTPLNRGFLYLYLYLYYIVGRVWVRILGRIGNGQKIQACLSSIISLFLSLS